MSGSPVRNLFAVTRPRQVALVSMAHGATEFYTLALPPILPLLVSDFAINYAEAGLLVTAYFVMYAVFQLPAGFVADWLGQRYLIGAGMVGMSGGMLLASVAPDFGTMVVAQGLAGLGGSTYHPSGMSLISDLQSSDTEGRAMGVHGLAGTGGKMLAPVFVGGLAAAFDWRLALAASAIVGVICAVAFVTLVEDPEPDGATANGGRTPSPTDAASPLARARRGVSNTIGSIRRIPLTRWLIGLLAVKVLFTFQSGAIRTFTTSYVYARTGSSAAFSNCVFFAMLAGSAVSAVGVGTLADRFDRVRVLTVAYLLAALFTGATALVPPHPAVYVGWFFVIGATVYAVLPVTNALTSGYAEREYSGGLFGLLATGSAVGSTVSPAVFGALATAFGIDVVIPAAALVSFAAGVGLLLFGSRVF